MKASLTWLFIRIEDWWWGLRRRYLTARDEEEPKVVAAEFCIFSQAWNIPKHSHIFSFPITWVWLIVCSLHLRKILMYFPKYNLSRLHLPKQYCRISGQLRDPSNEIFWQAEGPKQSDILASWGTQAIRYFGQLLSQFFWPTLMYLWMIVQIKTFVMPCYAFCPFIIQPSQMYS